MFRIWTVVGVAMTMIGAFSVFPDAVFAATEPSHVAVFMFGRDDCGFCKAQQEFLQTTDIPYEYLNVTADDNAARLFNAVAEKHGIPKVTPLTVVGDTVLQGFNGAETTGKRIVEAHESAQYGPIRSIEDHLVKSPKQSVEQGAGCDEFGIECDVSGTAYVFDLPMVGLVDLKSLSLFSLSALLGTIDGFNPCAMWVLITFLVLLSQAGSKRKMVVLAGVFVAAEAVMYNLILNVWYTTWDFVKLDEIVTPLVGFVALGGGAFFLYRWYKNRATALVCDITDLDTQARTVDKLKFIINQPLTLATVGSILLIAFSVNIIEFACSIGIPQAFTKILELNALSGFERQFYILIYTVGYMIDDFVVFGLAIWGYGKLAAHGHSFAQMSLLIGGALMLLLGALLVIDPQLLVL